MAGVECCVDREDEGIVRRVRDDINELEKRLEKKIAYLKFLQEHPDFAIARDLGREAGY